MSPYVSGHICNTEHLASHHWIVFELDIICLYQSMNYYILFGQRLSASQTQIFSHYGSDSQMVLRTGASQDVVRYAANIINVYFKNEKKPIYIEILIRSSKYIHIILIFCTSCARKFVFVLRCTPIQKIENHCTMR
jgi:hypothetical protein